MIHPANVNDIEGILDVLERTHLRNPLVDTTSTLATQMTTHPRSIFVARDERGVKGCAFILSNPWLTVLYHLAVHPEHQRQGIGSQLLDAAAAEARANGSAVLTIYIKPEEERLEQFYEKRGFIRDREYLSMDLLFQKNVTNK